MMIELFIAIFVLLFCLYIKWQYSYWTRRKISGPSPLPFFGNMLEYFMQKKHFGETYDQIYDAYPKASYVGIYKFTSPALLIRDLELVKKVLGENFSSFQDNDFKIDEKLDPLLAGNPFFSTGEKWKVLRGEVTPIFTSSKVKSTFPLVKDVAGKLLTYIDKNQHNLEFKTGFDANDIALKYTIESVASCSFGLEAKAFTDSNSEFVAYSKDMFQTNFIQNLQLMLALFSPGLKKIFPIPFVPKRVDNWFRSILNQVISHRDVTNEKRSDFLQALIDMRGKSGHRQMDENIILGHALSFLTEGYLTSSVLLTFCLYQLAINSDIQKNAQNEIDEIIKRSSGGELEEEMVQSMSYLENILFETLRMNSPVYTLFKICTKDLMLPPQYPEDQEGFVIKTGTPVIIPISAIHNDAKHFDNPTQFNPDRFTEFGRNQRHKYSFLGFSEGPRICPGMRFGIFQVKVAIASILSKYNIKLSPKTVQPLKLAKATLLLQAEDGIFVTFEKRK